MKSGTFVNYQLAEAILLLHEYNNSSSIDFNIALDGLKKKWKEDKIPSTGSPVPDLHNMQTSKSFFNIFLACFIFSIMLK